MNVHLRHIRQVRRLGQRMLCLSGIAAWCHSYGMDFEALCDPARGLPAEQLEATGDHWVLKAVAIAREEAARGQE